MSIKELSLEPRDVSLIKALKPFTGPFGQKIIDTLLEMSAMQSDGKDVQVLSPVWFTIKLQEVAQNAFTLFLILILLILATGGWPSESASDGPPKSRFI